MSPPNIARLSILRHPIGRWLLPVGAFLALLLATLAFAYHLHKQHRLEEETQFSIDSALVTVEIRDRLRSHSLFLQGLRAFVSSLPQLQADQWQRFSSLNNAKESLTGLQAFGFLPRVEQAKVAGFEAGVRKEAGLGNFRIFPPHTELEQRFPVLFVAPEEEINRSTLGFDLFSEPTRREAMELARDTDSVTMSQRLQLVMDRQANPKPGFLLFLPVYQNGLPTRTVAERQHALRGYVFAAYRMSDFMQTLNYARSSRFSLQIFDDAGFDSRSGGPQLALMYDTALGIAPAGGAQIEERELSFGHRTWLLRYHSQVRPAGFDLQNPAAIALVSGTVLATLVGALLWMLTTQGQTAYSLAQNVSNQLERSEQRFRLAAEGANDGLWHRDFSTGALYFSERALHLLGYGAEAFSGSEDFFLDRLHPEDIPRRRRALDAHLRQQAPYDLEVRLKRSDGSWGWFHLKGQATWDAQGHPLLMAGSISDISDRKQAELELRQHRDRLQELVEERTRKLEDALDQAREAARAKSEFLANMSHELRTPLHAMLGFAGLGKGKAEGNDKIRRYFERIHQSAERLLNLVNDLLDLAKLEARRMEVTPVLQDLRPTLDVVAAELDPLLQSKHLHLRVLAECDSTFAMVDSQRYAQVLHNLLSNAIRFSPPDGEILVRFVAAQLPRGRRASDQGYVDAIATLVEDQGPGVPADELDSIFDKFTQSTRTRTGAGGTGLGLAICLEIMAAHRGQIHAENRAEGGARFIATLPKQIEAQTKEENRP